MEYYNILNNILIIIYNNILNKCQTTDRATFGNSGKCGILQYLTLAPNQILIK